MDATELRFRAMGSDCHLIVVGGPPHAASVARDRVDALERKWSRFIDDSEVSRLNRSAGRPVTVSADTVQLVERAIEAWRLSGGAFDPTLLGAVIRIEGDRVELPHEVGFPGGIGKGLAADLVVADLMTSGADGACLNMGGDVSVAGRGVEGPAWTIAVEHPWRPAPIALLGLNEGAIATSTTLRRCWETDGQRRHHLIDPQTGLPSDTDINLATVVCREAWAAEVFAKAVLLKGSAYAFDILGGTAAEGLAVDDQGRVQSTSGMDAYLGRVRLADAIATQPPRRPSHTEAPATLA